MLPATPLTCTPAETLLRHKENFQLESNIFFFYQREAGSSRWASNRSYRNSRLLSAVQPITAAGGGVGAAHRSEITRSRHAGDAQTALLEITSCLFVGWLHGKAKDADYAACQTKLHSVPKKSFFPWRASIKRCQLFLCLILITCALAFPTVKFIMFKVAGVRNKVGKYVI